MEQTKRKPKLTKKERGFVKDYVLTENGTQSALKNYDTTDYKTASVIASENLDKPRIQDAIEEVKKTVAEALTDELLLKIHLEGLSASDQIVKDGEVLFEKPDYAVRHKYLDSAYKLKGSYASDKNPPTTPQLNVTLNIGDTEKIRMEYEEKLKQSLIE